jgi:ABC-2 type transport system ATP-binding protein
MKYILTTNDLTKNYKNHCAANKINIHIKKGEIYGLIGRNGAGKTTILRMISGLSNPSSGTYSINGKTNLVHERKRLVHLSKHRVSIQI